MEHSPLWASMLALLLIGTLPTVSAQSAEVASPELARTRAINEVMLNGVNRALEAQNADAQPLEAAQMTNGPYKFAIQVLDDKTGQPVNEPIVHAVIVAHLTVRQPAHGDGRAPTERMVRLGQLESQRCTDSSGYCRWEQLGRVEIQFTAQAKGYRPESQTFRIPEAGSHAVLRLQAAAAVTGRLVDAATNEPVKGERIALRYPGKKKSGPHDRTSYETQSDERGAFRIEGLPADQYTVNFPGLASSVREATKPCPIAPKLAPVTAKDGETVDLGTIRLEHAPPLELEILYEGAVPMASFPFEVGYAVDARIEKVFGGKTGDEGKARLALAGWRPNTPVIVYAPAMMSGTYQAKQWLAQWPDPDAQPSEREWFEFFKRTPGIGAVPASLLQAADYGRLLPAQQEAFQNILPGAIQLYREIRAGLPNLPDHPNYVLFTPQAGKTHSIKLNYQPSAGDLDLLLRFRDKTTGAPVVRFKGALSEDANQLNAWLDTENFAWPGDAAPAQIRPFQSVDSSGWAILPALTLSPGLLRREEAAREQNSPTSASASAHPPKPACLSMVVDALGYVRQSFEIPLTQARTQRELTFDLEAEAQVRGRVLLALTGEPLTSGSLTRLLQGTRLWNSVAETAIRGCPAFEIRFTSNSLTNGSAKPAPGEEVRYGTAFCSKIQRDGQFELRGLAAGAGWKYEIVAPLLPRRPGTDVALQAGMNDLGDIVVGGAGWLTGKVSDERGNGLPGVSFEFPLQGIGRNNENTTTTGAGGRYCLNLLPLSQDQQLVRLRPPWGCDALTTGTPRMKVNAMGDVTMELDRGSSNTLNARMERGHTLTIEIPPSVRLTELVRYYANPANTLIESRSDGFKRPALAIGKVVIQSLKPARDGLTYGQQCELLEGEALPTSTTVTLRIGHVPPGRHAVCVEGRLIDQPDQNPYRADPDFRAEMPLVYGEVDMPTTTGAKLRLEPPPADVEVELAELPSPAELQQTRFGPLVFLERLGSQSSFHGAALRRWLIQESVGERAASAEEFMTPLVGRMGNFACVGKGAKPFKFHKAFFQAVPPGDYRIQVYASLDELTQGCEPYAELALDVPPDRCKLPVVMPSHAPGRQVNAGH